MPKQKTIPLKWLEEWCEKNAFDLYEGNISQGFEKKPRFFVHTKEIIAAAKKQSEGTGKVNNV